MTCRLSSDSPHLMPCGSSHGRGGNVPQATDPKPRVITYRPSIRHTKAMPHRASLWRRWVRRRLIQWQGGNCVGRSLLLTRGRSVCSFAGEPDVVPSRSCEGLQGGHGDDTVNIKSMLNLYWQLTWMKLVNIYVL